MNNSKIHSGMISKKRLEMNTDLDYKCCQFYTLKNERLWSDWNQKYCALSEQHYDKWCRNTGRFAAYFWPNCISGERYEILHKFMIFLLNNDDLTELDETEGNIYWSQVLEMLDKLEGKEGVSMIKWKVYTTGFFCTMERIMHFYNQTQRKRFIRIMRQYVISNFMEIQWRKKYEFKDIEEWLSIRLKNIGETFCIQLIEFAEDIFVTDDEWQTSDFQNMYRFVVEQVLFAHELSSLKKELEECQYDYNRTFNGVIAIMKLNKTSLEEAIDKCLDIMKEKEMSARLYGDRILSSPDSSQGVKACVKAVYLQLSGHMFSSKYNDRYLNAFEEKMENK